MKPLAALASALAALIFTGTLHAQVPILLNYQGRVAVGTPPVNFDGPGQFRFALVNPAGTTAYWTNDGTHLDGTQPTAALPLTVTKGLCSVLLGDTSLGAAMTAIPASVFTNADVRLRVWFDDGTHGPQLLTPDQRIAPSAYLADGSVTSAKIADGAVDTLQIKNGAVGSSKLGSNLALTGTVTAPTFSGAFLGNGSLLTNVPAATLGGLGAPNFWQLGGNPNSTPGSHFLGTTNALNGIGAGITMGTDFSLSFYTNAVTQAVITAPGNVGIGTTNPTYQLDVNAGQKAAFRVVTANQDYWGFTLKNTIAPGAGFQIYQANTGPISLWNNYPTGALLVLNSADGNVGIGITSPENKLQVGSGWVQIDHGYGVGSDFRTVGGWYRPNFGLAIPHTSEYGSLNFLAHPSGFEPTFAFRSSLDNSAWMVLSRGNVGIGTTTPDSKLQIEESVTGNGGIDGVSAAYIRQRYSTSITSIDYDIGLHVDKIRYNVPSGVTANGYHIGAVSEVYVEDPNFAGTIDSQYAIWARTGMNIIGPSGPRTINNAYGIYIQGLTTPGGTITNHYGVYQEGSGTKNYFAGNVGIGNPNPQATLDVNGTVKATSLNVPANGLVVGTNQLALANGNVGIGTTLPAVNLHVFGSSGDVTEYIGSGDDALGRLKLRYNATSKSSLISSWADDGYKPLQFEGSTIVLNSVSGGNVGIGTTSPSQKLEVAGQILSSNATNVGRGLFIRSDVGTAHFSWQIGAQVHVDGGLEFTPSTATGSTTFSTPVVTIKQNGKVGIGTVAPSTSLEVVSNDASNPIAVFRQTNPANLGRLAIDSPTDDASRPSLITFRRAGVDRWSVGGIYGSDSFGIGSDSTTLNQKMIVTTDGKVGIGIGTATPASKLEVNGSITITNTHNPAAPNRLEAPVLAITGGADMAEPFEIAGGDIPEGSVVVIDEAHPGHLKMSDQPYDTRVAGIVSGAGGVNPGLTLSQQGVMEGRHQVALVGRVYARADATAHPIHPGDLLTTSPTPGHLMSATDRDRAQGAILGKAMTSLESGTGLVLVLVTLQ